MSAPQPKRRRFDSPEQEAYLNLWRTYDLLKRIEDRLFARWDLTAQQYNALRLLRGEHPETLPTLSLARRLVSPAPDITRMLDKLQARALVERRRPADNRRVVQVGISAAGLELLAKLDEPVRECGRQQLGHLTPVQLAQLTELLRQSRQPHEADEGPWA
ncbi:MAG TPA: MarR family transcriptional regulator [Pirellulaceae bacterium]|nr:MarR family transcriptional regulator [Pirellulaceae bacterium]